MGVGGSRGRLADLLSKDLRRTTIMLWIIWLAASFSYYGVVLMSTELFESSGQLCSLDGSVEESCSAQCHPLATSDYNHLLWTTLAEFPGIMVSLLLIEKIGRKKTLAIEFFLFTITLAIGVGSCSSIARFGAMLTPYIAQVLLRQSFQGAIAVYSVTTLLATACCLLLPIETKDREMGGSKG